MRIWNGIFAIHKNTGQKSVQNNIVQIKNIELKFHILTGLNKYLESPKCVPQLGNEIVFISILCCDINIIYLK